MKLLEKLASWKRGIEPRKRYAEVVEREGELIVYPLARADSGVLLADEPVVRIPSDSSKQQVGELLQETLKRTTRGVPHPGDAEHQLRLDKFLRAVGIGKWTTFMRGARMILVKEEGHEIAFIPTEREGTRGFRHLPKGEVRVASSSDGSAIGAAVAEALSRSL